MSLHVLADDGGDGAAVVVTFVSEKFILLKEESLDAGTRSTLAPSFPWPLSV